MSVNTLLHSENNKMTRLVYGWGRNDADYTVTTSDGDKKRHWCPIYRCWMGMIQRCYCSKYQTRKPTYIGCQVDERWRRFMAFRTWYLKQAPKSDEQLDKDFFGDGKLYSPETCCFVPRLLNMLFCDAGTIRGEWPQGVHYHKETGKYRAQIWCKNKKVHIGLFDTPGEAHVAYLEAKATYVEELLIEFPQTLRLQTAIRQKMAVLS